MFFSCKKDHSREGTPPPEHAWQFFEFERQFGGPVDSATLETSGAGETLEVFGTSSGESGGKFYLKFQDDNIVPGVYEKEGIAFQYEDGTEFLSTSDTSRLILTITSISDSQITGSFSGIVTDRLGARHEISNGDFHSAIVRKQSSKQTLTVWSKELCGDLSSGIEVWIDNSPQYITKAFSAQPSCGEAGAATFSLEPGNYTVNVVCGIDTIPYNVVLGSECQYLEVTLNNDYLPLVQNSFWEYADLHDDAVTQTFTANSLVDFNGETYTQMDGSRGDIYYFRKNAHIYYQFRRLSFQEFVADAPFVELVILKDNLAKGQGWESDPIDLEINANVRKVKMISRIIDRDYSDLIHGVRYDNLIRVNTELFFSPDNGQSYATAGSQFNTVFAKGKGIVSYNDMDVTIEWGIKNLFLSP